MRPAAPAPDAEEEVTDENKGEYVKLLVEHKLRHGINEQAQAFITIAERRIAP